MERWNKKTIFQYSLIPLFLMSILLSHIPSVQSAAKNSHEETKTQKPNKHQNSIHNL